MIRTVRKSIILLPTSPAVVLALLQTLKMWQVHICPYIPLIFPLTVLQSACFGYSIHLPSPFHSSSISSQVCLRFEVPSLLCSELLVKWGCCCCYIVNRYGELAAGVAPICHRSSVTCGHSIDHAQVSSFRVHSFLPLFSHTPSFLFWTRVEHGGGL